jgi:hypothetical protein
MSKARDLAVIEALTDLDGITDGTTGQVLTTDGSGTFTFSDSPSGDFVDDTTPQLGGDLDVNGNKITSLGQKMTFSVGYTTLSDRMVIDYNGLVGIGTTVPASFGAFNAKNLTVGDGASNQGITISSGSTSNGLLAFADGVNQSPAPGFIDYDHNNNSMAIGANFTNRINIDNSGIVFYEDTGTTAKLTWDASAESLKFADNSKAIFGASSDLQIYHDGSHSYIHDVGAGDLRLKVNDLTVQSTLGTYMMRAVSSGPVSLYYSNFPKLDTTSTGINVTGNIALSGTVDGRDVATDGTKLDGIAVNATNVSALTDLSISDGTNGQVLTTDGSGTFTFEDGGTNSTLTTYNFTATSNQTTFSGADSNSNTLSYAGPNLIVSVNGVVHRNGVEYTATNGTSVVFSSGLETSDEVSIVTFSVIDLTNIDYSNVNNTPSLATVATSGSYSDLSGTPSLATVATSGSYTDLSNTPLAYNSVGSYLLGYVNGPSTSGPSDLLPGQQLAGSYIRPAGIRLNSDSTTEFNANDEAAGGINAVTYRGDYVPSGTWRVMGNLDRGDNSTANYGRFTLFVRIS